MSEQADQQLPLDSHYAALDLGSNSFHLIVATESNGRLQVVDKLKEMVRLSEGLTQSKRLSVDATARAFACLERYAQRLRAIPKDHIRVVGTNALRQAKNAKSFLRDAEQALGHEIEIISGREEARLIYLGVAHAIEDAHEQRLVIDIGGGSTEIILGRRFSPMLMESVHMGCVSTTALAFDDGKLSASNFSKAIELAMQELEPVTQQYLDNGWGIAIGASGTILAAESVIRSLDLGEGISAASLDALIETMQGNKHLSTLSLAGLSGERAAVFPGGICILRAVIDAMGIERLNTSSGALREGLLHDTLGRAHHQDTRERTVEDLMRRYHVDVKHARRVRDTALTLLKEVGEDWQLDVEVDGGLLGWAALLHEMGMDIAHSQYHKHGGYLLQFMDMAGFSTDDQEQLAFLVRAHRRKFPKDLIPSLAPNEERLVRLAILLRLSVLLHRGRTGAQVPAMQLRAKSAELRISVPVKWLEAHPLTRMDLATEKGFLHNAGFDLVLIEKTEKPAQTKSQTKSKNKSKSDAKTKDGEKTAKGAKRGKA